MKLFSIIRPIGLYLEAPEKKPLVAAPQQQSLSCVAAALAGVAT